MSKQCKCYVPCLSCCDSFRPGAIVTYTEEGVDQVVG